jgi:hypothetical protein
MPVVLDAHVNVPTETLCPYGRILGMLSPESPKQRAPEHCVSFPAPVRFACCGGVVDWQTTKVLAGSPTLSWHTMFFEGDSTQPCLVPVDGEEFVLVP